MKCYISCPLSIPQWQLDLVQKRLRDAGNTAVFWERGTTYGEKEKGWIDYCDAFVIVLPEFAWQYVRRDLPIGCKKELDQAIVKGKPIYVAYRGQTNNALAVYQADISVNAHIRGISQTFSCLGQTNLQPLSFVKPEEELVLNGMKFSSIEQKLNLEKVVRNHDLLENSKVVEYCCTFEFEFHSYDRRLLLLM